MIESIKSTKNYNNISKISDFQLPELSTTATAKTSAVQKQPEPKEQVFQFRGYIRDFNKDYCPKLREFDGKILDIKYIVRSIDQSKGVVTFDI